TGLLREADDALAELRRLGDAGTPAQRLAVAARLAEKSVRARESFALAVDALRLARGPAEGLAPGAPSLLAEQATRLTSLAVSAGQARDALKAAERRDAGVAELVALNLELVRAASRQQEVAAGLTGYVRVLSALTPPEE